MSTNITRVFNIIHPSGQLFSLHNEQDDSYTLYSIECSPDAELTKQIPALCKECNFISGIVNAIKIGAYVDEYGYTNELYIVVVHGGNNERGRPTVGRFGGRWLFPDVLADKVTGTAANWVFKLKELRSWTLNDYIKYKVRY